MYSMSSLALSKRWDLVDDYGVSRSGLRPYKGHWHRSASGWLSPLDIFDVLFLDQELWPEQARLGFRNRQRFAPDDSMLPVRSHIMHHPSAYRPQAADSPVVISDPSSCHPKSHDCLLWCQRELKVVPTPFFRKHLPFLTASLNETLNMTRVADSAVARPPTPTERNILGGASHQRYSLGCTRHPFRVPLQQLSAP